MEVKKNVLLANQDYYELNRIYEYLEKTNRYNVMNAATLKTAKYIIENRKIDLLLLDWETFEKQDKYKIDYFYRASQQVSANLIVLVDNHQKRVKKIPYLSLQKPIDQKIVQHIEDLVHNDSIYQNGDYKNSLKEVQKEKNTIVRDTTKKQAITESDNSAQQSKRQSNIEKGEQPSKNTSEKILAKTNIINPENDLKEERTEKQEIAYTINPKNIVSEEKSKIQEEDKPEFASVINSKRVVGEEKNKKQEEDYKLIVSQIAEEKEKIQATQGESLRSVQTLKTSNPFFYDLIQKILPARLAELIEKHPDSQVDYYPEITCFILTFEDLPLAEAKYGEEVYFFIEKLFEYLQDMLNKNNLERIISEDNGFLATNPIHLSLENQSQKVLEFAESCNQFIQNIYQQRIKFQNFCLDYIIEIHTSSLIAGRVDKHTFAYDIWGKTTQNFMSPSEHQNIEILIDEDTKKLAKIPNTKYLGEFENRFEEKLKIYQIQ